MSIPSRLSVRQLLFQIAAIGVVLGALRYHISVGSLVFGLLSLTALRTHQVLDGFRDRGLHPTRRRQAEVIFGSFGVATAMLAIGMILGLASLTLTLCFNSHGREEGIFWAAIVIFFASGPVRRKLWPYRYPDPPCPPPPPAEESAQTVPPAQAQPLDPI